MGPTFRSLVRGSRKIPDPTSSVPLTVEGIMDRQAPALVPWNIGRPTIAGTTGIYSSITACALWKLRRRISPCPYFRIRA